MSDLRNPKARQQFLQKSIERNVLIRKLRGVKNDAQNKLLNSEATLIDKMIEYFENDSDSDYRDLRRQFRLRKLNLL